MSAPRRSAPGRGAARRVSVKQMSDYVDAHLGSGIAPVHPCIASGVAGNIIVPFEDAVTNRFRPVRAEVVQFSVELLQRGAKWFHSWNTPSKARKAALGAASLLSLLFIGTSKGYQSGAHVELEEESDEEGDEEEEGKAKAKKARKQMHRYVFNDSGKCEKMFYICVEEVYNPELTAVAFIRIWKMVFDPQHSDSLLFKVGMAESRRVRSSSGLAHNRASLRIQDNIEEAGSLFSMMSDGKGILESSVAVQFFNITNEKALKDAIYWYSAPSSYTDGKSPVDLDNLPEGWETTHISGVSSGLGGSHPLSPEYVFNAKRAAALSAGQVDTSGHPVDVHPDFNDPSLYFDQDGYFQLPDVNTRTGGFFIVVDPSINSIFDVPIPRRIVDSGSPGENLLELYRKREFANDQALDRKSLAARLEYAISGRDPFKDKMECETTCNAFSFDTMRLSHEKRMGAKSLHNVDCCVVTPRDVLKEVREQTNNMVNMLLVPYAKEVASETRELTSRRVALGSSWKDDADLVQKTEDNMDKRFAGKEATKDAMCMHIGRMVECFYTSEGRECVPPGYIAMFDGLEAELGQMPNKTASTAFAFDDMALGKDVTLFGNLMLMLRETFSRFMKISGRDFNVVLEVIFSAIDPFGDSVQILALLGSKGNGKSILLEVFQHLFPKGWFVPAGSASGKAAVNGDNHVLNGAVAVYDEPPPVLVSSKSGESMERLKQIVSKREYTHARSVNTKTTDGVDTTKTFMYVTPHLGSFVVLGNYGARMSRDELDHGACKAALMDRVVPAVVRDCPTEPHSHTSGKEVVENPALGNHVRRFRILVCLTAAARMFTKDVSFFQADLGYAMCLFRDLDKRLLKRDYNLPTLSPRRQRRRVEILRNMCAMHAVANVYLFKQSAVEFDAGRPLSGNVPRPFEWEHMYDVIRQMRPTPEMVLMAWSLSLEHNVHSSYYMMTSLSALCETFGFSPSDWLVRQPSARPGTSEEGGRSSVLAKDADAASERLHAKPMEKREIEALCDRLEKQRVATNRYRAECRARMLTDKPMESPVQMVEDVYPSPAHAGGCMPLHASCVLPTSAHMCAMHNPKSVSNWLCGEKAACITANPAMGTDNAAFEFVETGSYSEGASWITSSSRHDSCMSVANTALYTTTGSLSGYQANCIRDCILMSTYGDAERMCTEMPLESEGFSPKHSFLDDGGVLPADDLTKHPMMKMAHVRTFDGSRVVFSEALPRHPDSGVPDTLLQRSIDSVVERGCFPAAATSFSNNVRVCPPLRFVKQKDGESALAASLSFVNDHTRLVAEAMSRCSTHPGLAGMQEVPDSKCVGSRPFSCSQTAKDSVSAMSYSNDIVSISITLDVMRRVHDVVGRAYYQNFMECYDWLKLDVKYEEAPLFTTRFPGIEDRNNRLVSHKVPEGRNERFEAVAAVPGVDSKEQALVEEELEEEWLNDQSRDEMFKVAPGVRGDLYSTHVCVSHNVVSMRDRFMMTEEEEDNLWDLVADDTYNLYPRLAEAVSVAIKKKIDKDTAGRLHPTGETSREERVNLRKELGSQIETVRLDENLDRLRRYGYVCCTSPSAVKIHDKTSNSRFLGRDQPYNVTYHNVPISAPKQVPAKRNVQAEAHKPSKRRRGR